MTVSPLVVVPVKVQLETVDAVCLNVSAVVVKSQATHTHPWGAVGRFITGEQDPELDAKLPDVAPPVKLVGVPHPEAIVNVAPLDITPLVDAVPLMITRLDADGAVVPMPMKPVDELTDIVAP